MRAIIRIIDQDGAVTEHRSIAVTKGALQAEVEYWRGVYARRGLGSTYGYAVYV